MSTSRTGSSGLSARARASPPVPPCVRPRPLSLSPRRCGGRAAQHQGVDGQGEAQPLADAVRGRRRERCGDTGEEEGPIGCDPSCSRFCDLSPLSLPHAHAIHVACACACSMCMHMHMRMHMYMLWYGAPCLSLLWRYIDDWRRSWSLHACADMYLISDNLALKSHRIGTPSATFPTFRAARARLSMSISSLPSWLAYENLDA